MDIFSRNKFLLRLVFVLVGINIFSIGFQWWEKSRAEDGRPPKKDINQITAILTRELQLTPQQADGLKKIRADFFTKEEALKQRIRAQRDSMNVEMFNANTDTILVKNLARHVAENEYRMEIYRFEQAQQLKNICTKEQLQKLSKLVLEIRDFFQPQQNKKPKPPPDN